MSERWYKEAVLYSLQVDAFADGNGDGCGDFRGLISRLDYLSRIGVTCIWLNPIHPSPLRDNGYDITDYYGIHPRLGTLGDFAEFVMEARQRGIRVLLDLVVNHTSDEHPWFLAAQRDRESPYRDWYVWSDEEPPDRTQGMVFPGEQEETWSWSEEAGAWYYHRFYGFQPDLNWGNRAVRDEIRRVMGFWQQLGVAGFRVDAAPFILEQTVPGVADPVKDFAILDEWRSDLQWIAGDSVLLCEANVPADQIAQYTGDRAHGPNTRSQLMFAFGLNAKLWLALARESAEPLVEALHTMPVLPAMAQWVTFLRNHDELDLSTLTEEQRRESMRLFAPQPDMRIYNRGIRRRLAPMLRNDRRHIELAYALQFSMPGSPVLRYGEEIGMGERLDLDGRESIRTPMQWDDGANAGFSDATGDLVRPLVSRGPHRYRTVNVRAQQRDPNSLLRWFGQLIATLRECPEIGVGTITVLDLPVPPSVLVHRFDAPEGSILLLHNLADRAATVDIGPLDGVEGRPWEMLADGPYPRPDVGLTGLPVNGWGYRWIRLRRGRSN
jgi:maltose alpha-D-glucosyltransferase / alpha-amylase